MSKSSKSVAVTQRDLLLCLHGDSFVAHYRQILFLFFKMKRNAELRSTERLRRRTQITRARAARSVRLSLSSTRPQNRFGRQKSPCVNLDFLNRSQFV